MQKLSGRSKHVRTAEAEENVLNLVAEDPSTSSRLIATQLGISKSTVNRVTREKQLHPYHLQPVQALLPPDYAARVHFCEIIRHKRQEDLYFTSRILFTDEASFTRSGVTNLHNRHNVWMGIVENMLIGPFRLPIRLNGENYLYFLQNNLLQLLENVPLELRRNMWFMQDSAPAHFTRAVRNHLHEHYPGKWIGRGADAPIQSPPRSPDLTPCDFFLWGAIADKVYKERIDTEQQLWNRIVTAVRQLQNVDSLRRMQFNFLRRINLCREVNGDHFEQLMT
nr:unnamed protein product [Callosobruchus analis]